MIRDMIASLFILCFGLTVQLAASEINAASWNITAVLKNKKQSKILQNACGTASFGRMHAILGPSGSGKSTLMNAIAGVTRKGSIDLKGVLTKDDTTSCIYVQQEDILFSQLTTDETLSTSISLYQKTGLTEETSSKISALIGDLGLNKVRHSRVGDAKNPGLSGGEKKRLAIGNEIIDLDGKNAIIFADEPTSGLDCFQAQRVVTLLQNLSRKGNAVMISIHQPRPTILEMFDDITIMSEGRTIYSGPQNSMLAYFRSVGYSCPSNINPAEYFVDLVSIDYSSPEEERASRARVEALSKAFASSAQYQSLKASLATHKTSVSAKISASITAKSAVVPTKRRGILSNVKNFFQSIRNSLSNTLRTFSILHRRAWKQITRDKALNIARFASAVFSSLLFGAIYFKMSNGVETIPDRLGLLQVGAINIAMTSLIKATTSFVTEKLIVQRERRRNLYTVLPYFLAKMLAEVPFSSFYPCLSGFIMYKLCGLNPAPGRLLSFLSILAIESMASTSLGMSIGALVSTPDAGVAIAPAVMVIFIVFGGLYVVNAPKYLSWVGNISLIRWAYEALCVNEFSGLTLKGKGSAVADYAGEKVLDQMGFGKSTIKRALLAQVGIILANYVFTCWSLIRQSPKYEEVVPNEGGSSDITADSSNPKTTLETTPKNVIIVAENEESSAEFDEKALQKSSNKSAALPIIVNSIKPPLI